MNAKSYLLASFIGLSGTLAAGACGNSKTTTPGGSGGAGASGTSSSSSGIASSSSSGTASSSSSSGSTSSSSSGSTSSSSSSSSGSTSSSTSSSSGTCKTPTTLHPPKADAGADTIYCPFSGAPDAGGNVYCTKETQHCCEPAMGAATCDPIATPCAGGTDWQCEDPGDCASGVCCGTGTLVVNPDQTCANYATGFKGTKCAASCGAGEIEMCTSDGECNGKTCVPFGSKGNQVGGCQ